MDHPQETRIVLLIAAVQFLNILDFMMVMPLGPDFAAALDIPNAHLGWIGGSYTAAAAIAGLVGAMFLDRFARKRALIFLLCGLSIATFLGGMAVDFHTLLASRILAGAFGGPASAMAFAVIADVIPPARRGAAMGKVMGSFSLASIAGVPFGLELARYFDWHAPFFAVASLGALVMLCVFWLMPDIKTEGTARAGFSMKSLKATHKWLTLVYMATGIGAAFLIIPNIAAYVQFNLGYPREQMGLLYFCGGLMSLLLIVVGGRMADRWPVFPFAVGAALLVGTSIFLGFVVHVAWIPVLVLFILFMMGQSLRNVVAGTLASKVPAPQERAGFMSLLNSVQHLAMAGGAFLSSVMLVPLPGGGLGNMASVGLLAIALTFAVPLMMRSVACRVKRLSAPVAPRAVIPEL